MWTNKQQQQAANNRTVVVGWLSKKAIERAAQMILHKKLEWGSV